jgi:hypothetical protein
MQKPEILRGHVSPETAYVVDDYPYGYKLRCTIRYWLEHKPKLGFRLMSQTTDPRHGGRWNKPKAGTYAKFGACLYLADNGHVRCAALTEYCNGKEAKEWSDRWRDGVPAVGLELLDRWVAAKVAYDANRKQSDPLSVGLPQARAAFVSATRELSEGRTFDENDGGE